MVKRNGSYETVVNEKMRGGTGKVKIEHFLTKAEMYDKGRLFAKITITPGSSIGPHIHEGEMESFHIISGAARIIDDGTEVIANVGDTILTPSGFGHSVECYGDITLEMIALIIFD